MRDIERIVGEANEFDSIKRILIDIYRRGYRIENYIEDIESKGFYTLSKENRVAEINKAILCNYRSFLKKEIDEDKFKEMILYSELYCIWAFYHLSTAILIKKLKEKLEVN